VNRTIFVLLLVIGVAAMIACVSAAKMNMISMPFTPANESINAIMSGFGSEDDIIYLYNTTSATFKYARKRNTGLWTGTFTMMPPELGYMMKPVASNYNLTLVGEVPSGSISVPVVATTGGVKMNILGWNSALEECDINSAIPGGSENDMIYMYNTTSETFKYLRKRSTGLWTGTFSCLEPGAGYMFKPVASSYTWTYDRYDR